MLKSACAAMAAAGLIAGAAAAAPPRPVAKANTKCPVMKATIRDRAKAPFLLVNKEKVYFCCGGCAPDVKKDPAKYLKTPVKDVVTGKPFKVTAATPKIEHGGALFLFSSAETKATFEANPVKYAK